MFTANEAYESYLDGDPIMITLGTAKTIVEQHGSKFQDFIYENSRTNRALDSYDAWDIFCWLGY